MWNSYLSRELNVILNGPLLCLTDPPGLSFVLLLSCEESGPHPCKVSVYVSREKNERYISYVCKVPSVVGTFLGCRGPSRVLGLFLDLIVTIIPFPVSEIPTSPGSPSYVNPLVG